MQIRARRARSDAIARSPRGESRHVQIGPRIRVGGTLGKIGEGVKHAVPSVGQAIGSAIAGPVGTVLGGSIDGATTPTQKKIGNTVAAVGGGIAGAGALGVGPAAGASSGGVPAVPGVAGAAGAGAEAAATGGALDFIKKNWSSIAGLLGGAASAFATFEAYQEAQKNNARSQQLMDEGINMAKDDYASRGQYRDAAQGHLLNPTRPQLGNLFADPGNPYKNRVPSVGGLGAPQAPQGPSSPAPPLATGRPDGGRPADPITGTSPYTSPVGRVNPQSPSPLPPDPAFALPPGGARPIPTRPGEPVRGVPRPFQIPVVGRF